MEVDQSCEYFSNLWNKNKQNSSWRNQDQKRHPQNEKKMNRLKNKK